MTHLILLITEAPLSDLTHLQHSLFHSFSLSHPPITANLIWHLAQSHTAMNIRVCSLTEESQERQQHPLCPFSFTLTSSFCFLKAPDRCISVYRHQLFNVLTSERWFKADLLWYTFERNVCSINMHELWICMCQWCEAERQVMGFKTGWMLMVWMNNLKPGAVLVYTHTQLISLPLLFVLCRPTLMMKWGIHLVLSLSPDLIELSLSHTLFISLSSLLF